LNILYQMINRNMHHGSDMELEEVPKTSEHFAHLSIEEYTWAVSFKGGGLQSSLSPGFRMSSIFRIILTT